MQSSEPPNENIEPESSSFAERSPFGLGRWRVLPAELRLVDGEREVRLQHKEMALLLALCDGGDRPMATEALRRAVWGDQAITDGAAKNLVWQLRKSLGETAQDPDLIETVSGAGYRLTATPRPLDDRVEAGAESVRPVQGEAPAAATEAARPARQGVAPKPVPRVAWVLTAALLGLLGVAALVTLSDRFRDQPEGDTEASPGAVRSSAVPRPITGLPGREAEIELDPTGRHLLFSWAEDARGQADLYRFDLQDPDAAPLRLTATEEEWEVGGRFSPDGGRIAFVSGGSGRLDIRVMPSSGGAAKTLVTVPSVIEPELAWRADGRALFLAWWPDIDLGHRIHRLPLETGRPEAIFSPPTEREWDRTPAVSPDGERLAFSRWRTPRVGELRVLHLVRGEERVVAELRGRLGTLDWHSDDELLYTFRAEGQSSTLFTVPADGGAEPSPYPPTAGALDVGEVTAAASVVALEQSDFDLDILRFDGLDGDRWLAPPSPRRVAVSDRADFAPHLSPDGRRMVFISDRNGGFALWLSEGDIVRRLPVDGVTPSSNPRFSPDGQLVALSVVVGEQRDLVVVRPGDGRDADHVERLTDTPVRETLPTWRPDGLALRFFTPSGSPVGLWEEELWNPASRRLILEHGERSRDLPDGRLLYSHFSRLYLLDDFDGGAGETDRQGRRLDAGADAEAGPRGNWDATAEGVYWIPVGERTVRFYRFADGAVSDLLELDRPVSRYGLDVSADGTTLLVAVTVRDSSRILTVETGAAP